jgi:prevent-host-death family protein
LTNLLGQLDNRRCSTAEAILMTRTVNIHEAKTQLSKLIDAAIKGEQIVIAKAGTPLVALTPVKRPKRILGLAKGRGRVTDEFFEPMPADVIEAFEASR